MKECIKCVLDYVEERIDLLTFKKIVKENLNVQKMLIKYANNLNNCIFGRDIIFYIRNLNNTYADIISLKEILEGFLRRNNIGFKTCWKVL